MGGLDQEIENEGSGRTLHGVLDRRSSQKQAITALESQEGFPTHTGRILDVLSFVKNHILPLDALEVLLILSHLGTHKPKRRGGLKDHDPTNQLITRDKNMELGILIVTDFFLAPKLPQRGSILNVTPVWEGLETRHKPGYFLLPIMQG